MSEYAVDLPIARPPRIGEPAPDFQARTTHGIKKLIDYRGKWLVLFSHPSDFTPVCTTEFIAFAKQHREFQNAGCELLGLSIDSVFSHLAWSRNIEEKFGVKIPFPIIDDVGMEISRMYGMVQPGASHTSTVRALFIIDDQGTLRAMLYYPLATGRSISEILRLLLAIQVTDRHGISTPEGWQPGDNGVLPAPRTLEALDARIREGFECVDWYYCEAPIRRPAKKKAA